MTEHPRLYMKNVGLRGPALVLLPGVGATTRYDERFRRMWHFYLDGARANFECQRLQG